MKVETNELKWEILAANEVKCFIVRNVYHYYIAWLRSILCESDWCNKVELIK